MTKEEKINQIIRENGNSFHFEAVKKLRDLGWTVLISPYYTDNLTDKPREIDMIVERNFEIKDNLMGGFIGYLNIRLFVECEYINSPTIFWFDSVDEDNLSKRIMDNMRISDDSRKVNKMSMVKTLAKKHHYLKDSKVAKLFASRSNSNNNQENFYQAISQCLNSVIYYKNKKSLLSSYKYRINYPVILCKGFDNLIDADNKQKIKDRFLMEVNYAYKKDNLEKEEYSIIDVVDFDKLADYLVDLENEVSILSNMVT